MYVYVLILRFGRCECRSSYYDFSVAASDLFRKRNLVDALEGIIADARRGHQTIPKFTKFCQAQYIFCSFYTDLESQRSVKILKHKVENFDMTIWDAKPRVGF